MFAEVGGKQVADGKVAEKVKTQNKIIRDFLSGEKRQAEGRGLAAALDEIPGRKLH
ncbi:hypothetical protein [Mesorhizobium onobrychidis]|uniref:hypothetical protein n=1 Tax=Mesorhizobium onobrychidis TaxID=2775404 RepID=UPI0021572A6E|nr:hypothetical protein [Mesorhizobium onobrychidis]